MWYDERMKAHEFIQAVVDSLPARLTSEWQNYHLRRHSSQIQLHYGRPQLHYEVWVDHRYAHVEVGLHCEADAHTNLRLLDYFDRHLIEIRAESGQPVEAEHWTPSWTRVHRVVKFEKLDALLVGDVADCLAYLIQTLQPMLDSALLEPSRPDASHVLA